MPFKPSTTRYRNWYRMLIRLYPRAYREKFAESMMQTFDDLCAERERNHRSKMFGFVFWLFADTAAGIAMENFKLGTTIMTNKPIAWIGLALIVPFSILFAIGMIWQLLHDLGYADVPDIAALLPNKTLGFAIVFTFPAIAFFINAASIVTGALKVGARAALGVQFVKAHFFTLVVAFLSASAMLFAFGHDSIPCFVHGIMANGVQNIWQLCKTCAQA